MRGIVICGRNGIGERVGDGSGGRESCEEKNGEGKFHDVGLQWNCSGEIEVKNDLDSRDE
jgi:hypothetical protein